VSFWSGDFWLPQRLLILVLKIMSPPFSESRFVFFPFLCFFPNFYHHSNIQIRFSQMSALFVSFFFPRRLSTQVCCCVPSFCRRFPFLQITLNLRSHFPFHVYCPLLTGVMKLASDPPPDPGAACTSESVDSTEAVSSLAFFASYFHASLHPYFLYDTSIDSYLNVMLMTKSAVVSGPCPYSPLFTCNMILLCEVAYDCLRFYSSKNTRTPIHS
jgi:hypothetical protein